MNIFLQFSYVLLVGFAILELLPTDFPYRHTHDGPVYHQDDHDVCRAAGWMFGILNVWYFTIMFRILFNPHAIKQKWAERLLIYPNLLVAIVGLAGVAALISSYFNHSEETFLMVMGLLNGVLLLVISLFSLTVATNALEEGLSYGWSILAYTTGPFLMVVAGISVYEEQHYVTAFALITLLPFLLGIFQESKRATKKPFNL